MTLRLNVCAAPDPGLAVIFTVDVPTGVTSAPKLDTPPQPARPTVAALMSSDSNNRLSHCWFFRAIFRLRRKEAKPSRLEENHIATAGKIAGGGSGDGTTLIPAC